MPIGNGIPTIDDAIREGPSVAGQDPSTISPYTTRAVTVRIGSSRVSYTVLEAMVDQYSGLRERLDENRFDAFHASIDLAEVDEDIGHTLIHYLYTGHYETLDLGSVSEDVKANIEFKRSVLAYCAARLCGIAKLEDSAKIRVGKLSKHISVFDLQHVTEEVSAKLPRNDDWFSNHLHTWIKAELIADDTIFTQGHILDVIGRCAIFDKAVVKAIAEIYIEVSKLKHLVDRTNNTTLEQERIASSPEIESTLEMAAHGDEHAPESPAAPLTGKSTPDQRRRDVEPTPRVRLGLQIEANETVPHQPAQDGSDVAPHCSEETVVAETPSELSAELPSEARVNGHSNEVQHADNSSKAADSDGDIMPKSKSKKKKKGKKQ